MRALGEGRVCRTCAFVVVVIVSAKVVCVKISATEISRSQGLKGRNRRKEEEDEGMHES
jgi:hypothetical protein